MTSLLLLFIAKNDNNKNPFYRFYWKVCYYCHGKGFCHFFANSKFTPTGMP